MQILGFVLLHIARFTVNDFIGTAGVLTRGGLHISKGRMSDADPTSDAQPRRKAASIALESRA